MFKSTVGHAPEGVPVLPDHQIDALLARLRSEGSVGPFKSVPTVDAKTKTVDEVVAVVQDGILHGIPVVVQNSFAAWRDSGENDHDLHDDDLFTIDWLKQNEEGTHLLVRNVCTGEDVDMSVGAFVDYLHEKPPEERQQERNLLYGKDIVCPGAWAERTHQRLPAYFQYKGPNDLVPLLPAHLQPDNLMAYVGFDGTNTPGHTDLCGSVGHNVMVHADEGARAIWFLADSGSLEKVSKFWQEQGHSIYEDNFFASLELLENAPFTVYVIEQKRGDFVLVPPEAAHQVLNKGGVTIKVSWNRVTVDSLRRCVDRVLAEYQAHMRPEIYRIKALVHNTLLSMTKKAVDMQNGPDERSVEDFRSVIECFAAVVKEEWIEGSPEHLPTRWSDADQPHSRTCDFCRADIWNRGFTCIKCAHLPDVSGKGEEVASALPQNARRSEVQTVDIEHILMNRKRAQTGIIEPIKGNPFGQIFSPMESDSQSHAPSTSPRKANRNGTVAQEGLLTAKNSTLEVTNGSEQAEANNSPLPPIPENDDATASSHGEPRIQRVRRDRNKKPDEPNANGTSFVGNGQVDNSSTVKQVSTENRAPTSTPAISMKESNSSTATIVGKNEQENRSQIELEDEFDICLGCYARGRSCPHEKAMTFHQYLPMQTLKSQLEEAVKAYNRICKSPEGHLSKEWIEGIFNGSSNVLPTATIAYHIYLFRTGREHARSKCCHACRSSVGSPPWTFASDACGTPYCARCLWNRFGLRLFDVKKDRNWVCPKCNHNCNCLNCLKRWDSSKPIPFPIPTGDIIFVCEQGHYLEHRHSNVLVYDKQYPTGPMFKDNKFVVEPPPALFKRDIVGKIRRGVKRVAEEVLSAITPSKKVKSSDLALEPRSSRRKSIKTEAMISPSATTPTTAKRKMVQTKSGRKVPQLPPTIWAPVPEEEIDMEYHPPTNTKRPRQPSTSARKGNPSTTSHDGVNPPHSAVDVHKMGPPPPTYIRKTKTPRLKLQTEEGPDRSCREILSKMDLDPAFLKEYFVESMSLCQERGPLWAGVHADDTYKEMLGLAKR
ncbi:uncharacterized protein SPPG_06068 [Spizellomyces punctatus DAOM BR117]|uniref:JmjC domain-containing protein n=1 Tax=Spizellomyces punctatus (strain DAOM BR117) TaxID=645134 RepID=A0A0L0H9X4_SPIPD|nr:uncharacterized protein SPPG_06068 [Spizellomyces punctatus DAOM BR117]KNC98360.1 hypothetical protein SPPG_06068 [Spizellomyces punctatus DAOM BR117]|eukprot:XP_016606400.1 hypothetical protein SPPG_06068 [Spizellomyces punctatus DAOM BR117]